MKTPDEIKKGLENCRNRASCMKCTYYDKSDTKYACEDALLSDSLAYIQQLEDHIREAPKMVPKWISVEDKEKPRHGKKYLCVCTLPDDPKHEWDWMMVLEWYYNGSNGYVDRPHFTDEGFEGMTVTHWMPLPEPPKEE